MRKGSIVALIAVAIAVVLVGVMISFRPRVATSASAAEAPERSEDVGEAASESEGSEGEESEGEEPEGEDPAREAAEHVGAAVTAEGQSAITVPKPA
jgi:flagellar basal body-associated protein FliL